MRWTAEALDLAMRTAHQQRKPHKSGFLITKGGSSADGSDTTNISSIGRMTVVSCWNMPQNSMGLQPGRSRTSPITSALHLLGQILAPRSSQFDAVMQA